MSLWLVEIDDDDWDYDRFQSAAVWASSAEDAERIIREQTGNPEGAGNRWVQPGWKLHVAPAPKKGVVLMHWHAG